MFVDAVVLEHCLLSTSAHSALEVLHIMRYINLLTYLLTLLTDVLVDG